MFKDDPPLPMPTIPEAVFPSKVSSETVLFKGRITQRDHDRLLADVTVIGIHLNSENIDKYLAIRRHVEKPIRCMRALMYRAKYPTEEDKKRFKDLFSPKERYRTNFNNLEKEEIFSQMGMIFPEIAKNPEDLECIFSIICNQGRML